MTEKELIESQFKRVDENDNDYGEELAGPRHHYFYELPKRSGWFMTPANIFVNNDEWGAWININDDELLITDMEDLKTFIGILEKYIP